MPKMGRMQKVSAAEVGRPKPAKGGGGGGKGRGFGPPDKFPPGNNGKIGGEKPVGFPLLGGGGFKSLEQLLMLKMLMNMMSGGSSGSSSPSVDYGMGNTYQNPYPGTYGQYQGAPSAAPGAPQSASTAPIPSQMSGTPYITPSEVSQAQQNTQNVFANSGPTDALGFTMNSINQPPITPDQSQPGPNGYTPSPTAGGNNNVLSPQEVYSYYRAAGFSDKDALTMTAISYPESGLDPNSQYHTPQEDSYGLAQINTKAHPEFDPKRLLDPAYNAQAAFQVFKQAGGFGPWTGFTSGKYKPYEQQLQAQLAGQSGGGSPLPQAPQAPQPSSSTAASP